MPQLPRRSYLQFHIPLDRGAGWFRDLNNALAGVRDVRWQPGFYHITAAFVNDKIDTAEAEEVAEILDGMLKGAAAPVVTFDTLDAFTTQGGGTHVVYLTASRVPDEWKALVDKVRSTLKGHGYHLGPYQLHVTLARIPAKSIDLESLRERIAEVDIPAFSSTLATADYRFYREFKHAVREWTLPVR